MKRFMHQSVAAAFLLAMFVSGARAQSPPTLAKAFSAATVGLNNSVTLTFTLTNPNPATDLTGVGFSDDMPAGLLIANPDSVGGDCDTSLVTTSATNLSLTGAVLPANSSCSISIDVLAVSPGDQVNTTGAIASTEGGTGGTATATVSVLVPDLTIVVSHSGTFVSPSSGNTYTITVSNVGGADTLALITVNDSLPSGLSATSISGTNWNCTLSPLQCTRGDVLFAGTSFEPITVTVNVAAKTSASVTNTATVSGGVETNTANNSASDPTQIIPALAVSMQSPSVAMTAGSTASVAMNVTNNGAGLGAITFACSGLPAGAACSFNPPSVTASSQVTLSISTTAKSTEFVPLSAPHTFPPVVLFALLALTAFSLSQLRSKKAGLRVAGAMACLMMLAVAGCGGGSSTPVQHNPGTPIGTFSITVSASSASSGAAATNTLLLTVQ
jgi:uncharacterized repeat protein (TIGR01451 family)